MRRTNLRHRAKPARVIEADLWRDGLGPCVMKHQNGYGCDGTVQGHHVITQGTLRKRGFGDKVLDRRNRIPLCKFHHEQHHSRFSPVWRDLLPDEVWEFAAETDLEYLIERYYPVRPGESVTREAI